MAKLTQMKCEACQGDEPTISDEELAEYRPQVPEWEIVAQDGARRLLRTFDFEDFVQAMAFTHRVGRLAEVDDHHPVITTEWGAVSVTWWTHKIDGLHRNDFIMAAKCDQAYQSMAEAVDPGIFAVHGMFYTPEADAAREVLRDTLGLAYRDVGDGWLIFDVPLAEIGCHPAEDAQHDIDLVCHDIDTAVAILSDRGIEFDGPPQDEGWGRVTAFTLPGGVEVGLYEPAY